MSELSPWPNGRVPHPGQDHDWRWTLASWPMGPDGETASLEGCPCGETREFTEGDEE